MVCICIYGEIAANMYIVAISKHGILSQLYFFIRYLFIYLFGFTRS